MLLVNIDYIPGKEFEVLGVCKGAEVIPEILAKTLWQV